MSLLRLIILCLIAALAPAAALAQSGQWADESYHYDNNSPAFAKDAGPQIVIGTDHSVFVADGSYRPLAKLAESDGFPVRLQKGSLTDELASGKVSILVLINAYLRSSYREHPAIDPPSAFSDAEIEAIRAWVEKGGSLLLLADHAPLGGGLSKLAATFGYTMLNGYAAETRYADANVQQLEFDFKSGAGLNGDHPITNGGTGRAPIKHFYVFGGQAFIPPDNATSLLRLPEGWSVVFTYRARTELANAARIDASGTDQGAVSEYGKGRIAVFTDAGAFSAQSMAGIRKMGFNAPEGADNPEFVLSVLRWLAHFQKDK